MPKSDRPVVIVTGSDRNLTHELAKKIGKQSVVMHFNDSDGNAWWNSRKYASNYTTHCLPDTSEGALASGLQQIERQYGTISGFVYLAGNPKTEGLTKSSVQQGAA